MRRLLGEHIEDNPRGELELVEEDLVRVDGLEPEGIERRFQKVPHVRRHDRLDAGTKGEGENVAVVGGRTRSCTGGSKPTTVASSKVCAIARKRLAASCVSTVGWTSEIASIALEEALGPERTEDATPAGSILERTASPEGESPLAAHERCRGVRAAAGLTPLVPLRRELSA